MHSVLLVCWCSATSWCVLKIIFWLFPCTLRLEPGAGGWWAPSLHAIVRGGPRRSSAVLGDARGKVRGFSLKSSSVLFSRPRYCADVVSLTTVSRDNFAFDFSLPTAHIHRNHRLLVSTARSLTWHYLPFLRRGCSFTFRPCTRPKMHPDCPTVSPYRTPSKLQLSTLQARLALFGRAFVITRALLANFDVAGGALPSF